ncbi:hypothetical protein HMF3257_29785 [Spirosoma telluris]|uniref:Uncharacterized protein n=2 Tax=Spirosoma telluris TaxID=2183553 RepID=A0A327NPM6_9BACT|nr:hypothetical protein HMF3257_29785 [Spirosoma telluris]
MRALINLIRFSLLLLIAIIVYTKPLLAQGMSVTDTAQFNNLFSNQHKYLVNDSLDKLPIKFLKLDWLKKNDNKANNSQKVGKILGYTGLGLLLSSIFISKVDKQFGKGVFIAGCAVAPIALFFSIRGKKIKDRVPSTNKAYVEKPLTE